MTNSLYRFRSDLGTVQTYRTVLTLEALSERYGVPVDQWVKLNQNENPYGPAPEALTPLGPAEMLRYPDPASSRLREALAEYCGVDAVQIVCGAGGDEIIDVIFRLFVDPGDEVI